MQKVIKIIFTISASMLAMGILICLIILVRIDFDYTKLSSIPLNRSTTQVGEQFSASDVCIESTQQGNWKNIWSVFQKGRAK